MKNQEKNQFNKIREVISSEFEVQSNFFEQKSRLPKLIKAFRALICLCIASGISGADIGRLTGRRARSVYKTRNSSYKLLEKDQDFKEQYNRAKKTLKERSDSI